MNKTTLLSIGFAAASALTSQAAISWTGAIDSAPFDDGNWDFSGSTESSIVADVAILDNITVTNVAPPASGSSGGSFAQFKLGEGYSMTITNTSFDFLGTDGVAGSAGGSQENINLIGSSLNIQFASVGIDINVDGTSSLNIRGGGDGINSQTAPTRVNLSVGGQLTLPTLAEFTEQGNEIFVNGVSYNSDTSILSFSGTTATAVPEPASTALLGLGGIALILRRRK